MIEKHETYLVRCDNCTQILKSKNGFFYFSEYKGAKEYAKRKDWIKIFGKTYCPDCVKELEMTEEIAKCSGGNIDD